MPPRILLLILSSVPLSGLAQVSFKYGVSSAPVSAAMTSGSPVRVVTAFAFSPGVIAGLAMYGVGTLMWLTVLSRTPLSLAYPFVGLSFIITAACGYFLFGESANLVRLLGTALVIAGVVLVGSAQTS